MKRSDGPAIRDTATGATARRLALPGAETCVYLRTLDDARHLRGLLVPGARVAVVGAGFIGLEVAACASGSGCDVAVFEASSRILSRGVHPEIAEAIHERHVREGVKLFFGHSLVEISLSGTVRSLRFSEGFTYDADIVLIGVGAQPSTELAEISGLEVSAGVVVDGTLRTGDPDIFAAGDCCRFPLAIYDGCQVRLESWRAAQQQGLFAARNMLGENAVFDAVPWFWSDQYDLTLQVAGLIDRSTRTVRREIGKGHLLFHLDGANRLVAASALGAGNALAKELRLAEMLIGARKVIEPGVSSRPEVSLKRLLAA